MELSNPTAALESGSPPRSALRSRISRYEKYLLVIILLSLPLCNPWVHGDGVGYYALARAPLIEHRLDFQKDWLDANPEFRMAHTDAQGRVLAREYTATNHINNHFAIGPAVLWAPFLVGTHAVVLIADALGAHIPANGFSRPYVVAMALATALYGFLALWISFDIARRYVTERWAFLATIGIWFASSLPVYMYFNPSWSHAHSAFAVALFVWYWDKTRTTRPLQWILLGLIGGLMMDVYYVSAVILLLPVFEFVARLRVAISENGREVRVLVFNGVLFLCAVVVAFVPTLVTKKVIFGSYFNFGYTEHWYWNSPALLKVCFSSEHGLFSWTPIIIPAVVGLFFLARHDRNLAWYLLVVFAVYLYTIGCYENWAGIASFGNRFFVSLTSLFILGLAAIFDQLSRLWSLKRCLILARVSVAVFILWNLGLMYQWGAHLIPVRGPISWRRAAYNQFAVVPGRVTRTVEDYLVHRGRLIQHIEDEDIKQLKSYHPD